MSDFGISKTGILQAYTGSGGAVVIPEGVTRIGVDAFCGCHALIIHTPAGSNAGQYARDHGIPVENI